MQSVSHGAFVDVDMASPPRKAMRMTEREKLPPTDVLKLCDQMLRDAESGKSVESREFILTGKLPLLCDDFFDDDMPIVGEGNKKNVLAHNNRNNIW